VRARSGNRVTPTNEADCNDDQRPDDTTYQVRLHNVILDYQQRSLTQLLGIVQIIQNRMTNAILLGYNDTIQQNHHQHQQKTFRS
jgi:hypothetical protein